MRASPTLLSCFAIACAAALPARADPQISTGLTVGVGGRGYHRSFWDETVFHLGLNTDILFGRQSVHDFGLGPYLELRTLAFDEVQWGTGASLLVPAIDAAPLIISTGVYGRVGDDPFGVEPGWATALFFGLKSYNYSSPYILTNGIATAFRYGLGESSEMSLLIVGQLDLALLAMPFVYLAEAVQGGSPEVDPVEPEITGHVVHPKHLRH